MSNAAIKGTVYCLSHTPELAFHYGTTPYFERKEKPDSPFLASLPKFIQPFGDAARYAPNLVYIGAMSLDQFEAHPRPWHANLLAAPARFGRYGEIMPEDEFLGLMDISDVFDLIWLEEGFSASVREKLKAHPVLPPELLKRLKKGRELSNIQEEIAGKGALPLHFEGRVVGCCRCAHEVDECLSCHVIMENLASKAGSLLSLFHLMKKAGLGPSEVDFVIECSEEAAGDMNQRGGGNFAKAIAEVAGCVNASGLDIRAFCAAPVNALITGASLVASGARKNVVVLAGGAVPKLYMNARDHVKKGQPALENCLGSFAALLTPDDGSAPVLRLDALGKHSVGAGASPQAVTTALVWEPLQKAGLRFADVDRYAAELHIPEITLPAGAGDVPEANARMIAALAVMKGQLKREEMNDFVARHGLIGFAHTQGHIPSGIPFLGHAVDAIVSGAMKRAMIIGKGSLFLARLTNLADGASFLVEPSSGGPADGLTRRRGQEHSAGCPGESCGFTAEGGLRDAMVDKRKVTGEPLSEQVEQARRGGAKIRVGFMAAGSELGMEHVLEGALMAASQDPRVEPVAIGGSRLSGYDRLEWIETPSCEADMASALESALEDGRIQGAVALHYSFPLGVTTIGRVLTPGRGKPLFIASSTGLSASYRTEAMLRNAIYGIAVARATGLESPTIGILNLEGAASIQRALVRLSESGYPIRFASSVRAGGGSLLRGNDLLAGAADICVCDTLTGNVLVKLFSAFHTGGSFEALGWGYGPSVGEKWGKVVSIISRASGAPVISNALCYTASVIRGKLVQRLESELAAARSAGLDQVISSLVSTPAAGEEIQSPPREPTDSEIHGVDVLSIEGAVKELWKAGIYSEPGMGCTGPVVKVSGTRLERSKEVLSQHGYL